MLEFAQVEGVNRIVRQFGKTVRTNRFSFCCPYGRAVGLGCDRGVGRGLGVVMGVDVAVAVGVGVGVTPCIYLIVA
jgi:hypothetical protein